MTWQDKMRVAFRELLAQQKVTDHIPPDHLKDTPERVVRSFEEYFSGLDVDPGTVLERQFKNTGKGQMIMVTDIDFVSFCAHHLVPIIGKVHFGYLPEDERQDEEIGYTGGMIVGLSKIPRLIEVLSKRPQVQEQFGNQIVDVFMKKLKPAGCGVVVDALHMCMAIRGVKKFRAVTRTTALRGSMLDEGRVRAEFLSNIPPRSVTL